MAGRQPALNQIKKSNLHHTCAITRTRAITRKRVTSGGIHLHGFAPGQHSSEETTQRWRAVVEAVSNLTVTGIEPQTSRTDSDLLHN